MINALTLYSVLQDDLIPQGKHAPVAGHSPLVQFFDNIGSFATDNHERAVVLFGMLWTLVIWVISAISLAASLILYLLFLFHHIPSEDGNLSTYCRRKINRRMERIIKTKVDKALKKENQLRARQEAKDGREVQRQPTLPLFDAGGELAMPGLSRHPTQTTPPEYSSQTGSDRNSSESFHPRPTLPDVELATSRPPPPSRTATHASSASWASYASKAPLMGEAAGMGYSNSPSVEIPGQPTPAEWPARPPPTRSMTGMSQPTQRSYTPGFGPRSISAQGDRPTPGAYPMEPLSRTGTGMSTGSTGRRGLGPSPTDFQGRRTPAGQYNPYFPSVPESGRQSPNLLAPNRSQTPNGTMPPPRSFTPGGSRSMTPGPESVGAGPPDLPRLQPTQASNSSGYRAYTPNNHSGMPYSAARSGPYRSFTDPNVGSGLPMYSGRETPQSAQAAYPPQRSGTAPLSHHQYSHDDMMDDIVNGYR